MRVTAQPELKTVENVIRVIIANERHLALAELMLACLVSYRAYTQTNVTFSDFEWC